MVSDDDFRVVQGFLCGSPIGFSQRSGAEFHSAEISHHDDSHLLQFSGEDAVEDGLTGGSGGLAVVGTALDGVLSAADDIGKANVARVVIPTPIVGEDCRGFFLVAHGVGEGEEFGTAFGVDSFADFSDGEIGSFFERHDGALALALAALGGSVEVIEEGGDAGECRFLLVFDFDVELNLHLADASEVTDVVEFSDESHALSGEHGLSELHLVHAVVHEHLDVLDFDDLFPEVGQKAEGEIAVDDGLSEGTFFGSFGIYVNPLVVQGGVGKKVDAFLVHLQPVGFSEFLSQVLFKFFVGVDGQHFSFVFIVCLFFRVVERSRRHFLESSCIVRERMSMAAVRNASPL